MNEPRGPRLRPSGSILVTRIRTPTQGRTACLTVLFADLRGHTGMVERLPAARAGEVLFSHTVAAALRISAETPGSAASTSFLQLPQFELRGRRGPIDIWCVPAPERLAL